jgi:hypothetical protein
MMMVHIHKARAMVVQTGFCTIMYSLIIFNYLICSLSNRFIQYYAEKCFSMLIVYSSLYIEHNKLIELFIYLLIYLVRDKKDNTSR